jgi:hypothetical protein
LALNSRRGVCQQRFQSSALGVRTISWTNFMLLTRDGLK